ncbi:MAG: carbohydrate kinase family protein [Pedosphaera sp.]|nr:carbohydrate kinase family protein [Pedosphaera sp.]
MLTDAEFRTGSLCVVGNINRDIKTSRLAPAPALFQDGETSLDWVIETIGGGGANSAFTAAALGAYVSLLAKVGADALGTRHERTLKKHGVTAFLARDPSHRTGTSLALSFQNGRRHFLSCLPASRALEFADLNLQALEKCKHLLRADIWFSEAMLFGGNALLFKAAAVRNLTISVDLNWDPAWGNADSSAIQARKQAVRDVLPYVSLAHGNARELCEFADTAELQPALEKITRWGADAVVVHLGEQGAGFYQNGKLEIEPPVLALSPVTNTGTGDVLSVCMMLLHSGGAGGVRERLRLANTVVSEFMEGKRRFLPDLED